MGGGWEGDSGGVGGGDDILSISLLLTFKTINI
jgi:hypothetical protein